MKGVTTQFYLKAIFVAGLLLIVFCATAFFSTIYIRKADANNYGALVKSDLIMGDYRSSMVRLKLSLVNDFSGLEYQSHSGEIIFRLGEKKSGFYLHSKVPIGLKPGSHSNGYLVFRYNPWWNVLTAAMLWFLLAVVNIPVLLLASKRLERLYEKQKEEKYLAKVGTISRQMSHDIRSPLSALRSLERKLDFNEASKRQLYLNIITRLECIAEEVLNYGAPSKATLHSDSQNIQEDRKPPLIKREELERLIARTIALKDYEWDEDAKPSIKTYLNDVCDVFGVEVDISRMLSNVLNNSLEARATAVVVSTALSDAYLNLEIRDNGVGISKSLMKKIMHEKSYSTKESGHGLGLSHVKSTVKNWGGNFDILSEEGIGTTIVISLRAQSS